MGVTLALIGILLSSTMSSILDLIRTATPEDLIHMFLALSIVLFR
jgi:hypothetical protein